MADFKPLRKAMVVIAVSNYDTYDALPGTLTSARRIAAWAEQPGDGRGYKVVRITDEPVGDTPGQPVTAERLKSAITGLLETTIIDRLVIYFAGHGVIRSTAEEFWLLSHAANDRSECVGVMAFLGSLKVYGIGAQHPDLRQGQLVVIADACRNVDATSIDLTPNPILTKRGTARSLQTDIFRATTLGAFAYQVKAVEGGEPYCLFSSVLCDALEGKVESVIERQFHPFKPAIVNDALANYLDDEVPRRAAALNEKMEPDNQASIRAHHNYYDILSAPTSSGQQGDLGADPQILPPIDPGDFDIALRRHDGSPSPAGGSGGMFRPRPVPPHLPQRGDHFPFPFPVPTPPAKRVARMELEPVPDNTGGFRRSLRRAELLCGIPEERPSAAPQIFFDGTPHIAVPRRALDAIAPVRFGHHYLPPSALSDHPVFVQHDQGWTLVPLLQGTTSVVLEELPGELLLRPVDADAWDVSLSTGAALERPTRLSEAPRLAEQGRLHPNDGIRAGYLYRLSGDDDNVVRTAHEMAGVGLPVDLALLAASRLIWRRHGDRWQISAAVPAVDADDGWRRAASSAAFPQRDDVPVWGLFPLHRQGWHVLASANTIDAPDVLREAAGALLSSPAVSFDTATVQSLCETFDYVITSPTG